MRDWRSSWWVETRPPTMRSWRVTSGTVVVNFLPPLATDNLKNSDLEALTNNAHDQIAACLQGAATDV